MKKKHIEKILSDFAASDHDLVISLLESITLTHVMADSQANLDNTWSAILELSCGDLYKLKDLIEAAKKDFRDVIYWAILDKGK